MENHKQNNEIIKDFLRFLMKRNLYESFLFNWSNLRHTRNIIVNDLNLSLLEWFGATLKWARQDNLNFSHFIDNMSQWNRTNEGYFFWKEISNEWERFFVQKYKQNNK